MKYPECEKMEAVNEKSQAIGEFLEWLSGSKGVYFMVRYEHEETGADMSVPFQYSTEELLAEFFNIDLKKVEKEKRHMLEGCRLMGPA